jgi:2,4-dienoyl-CoA reductase-like NADH-dependent reductase (Old Yellow Enzyme family)
MSNNVDALFTPFTFKGLTLENRIAMAPTVIWLTSSSGQA